jgi:hypothetical protein
MSQITLNTPVEIIPAQQAVTTTKVTVLEVRENYGWDWNPQDPGAMRRFGPGRPQSVEATILLEGDQEVQRNITVWEGDAYVAVRGSWTDEDMAARISQILTGA